MKKYLIIGMLITSTLLAGCSNSASDSSSSKKTKTADNTAYAKKKIKTLCSKIDTSVFSRDRHVTLKSNLEAVKDTHKKTISQYKLVLKTFKDIAKNEKNDLLKPKADAFVKNLEVLNKQYPELAKLNVEMYVATRYTEVPTEYGNIPITKEQVDNARNTVQRNLLLLEPIESDININEREFWWGLVKVYPYSCFKEPVKFTVL